jgi:hypothetical protein
MEVQRTMLFVFGGLMVIEGAPAWETAPATSVA